MPPEENNNINQVATTEHTVGAVAVFKFVVVIIVAVAVVVSALIFIKLHSDRQGMSHDEKNTSVDSEMSENEERIPISIEDVETAFADYETKKDEDAMSAIEETDYEAFAENVTDMQKDEDTQGATISIEDVNGLY